MTCVNKGIYAGSRCFGTVFSTMRSGRNRSMSVAVSHAIVPVLEFGRFMNAVCSSSVLAILASAFAVIGGAASAQAPSFSCNQVETGSIEEMICKDGALSSLDRKLADVYAQASRKATNAHPPTLQAEQRGWIKGRDECWKSDDKRACVQGAYEHRIAELQARYRLVPGIGPITFICDGDPRNEVSPHSSDRSGDDDRGARRQRFADVCSALGKRRPLSGTQRKLLGASGRSACDMGLRRAGDALQEEPLISGRQPHRRAQAPERALAQHDVTAMRTGDIAGDGKAEARAALVLVAGLVEAHERLEDLFAHVGGNARPVVVHMQDEPARFVIGGDLDPVAVPRGVADEVEQQAAERVGAHRDDRVADDVELRHVALPLGVRLHLLEELAQIRRHRLLAGIAASPRAKAR